MHVLVVGGGGREHALVWALRKSPRVKRISCIPGNPGIGQLADCVQVEGGVEDLADWASAHGVDLTVVGPEAPLSVGIAEAFARRDLRLFGPSRRGARLETSKAFAKAFMQRYQIPTGSYRTFTSLHDALDYGRRHELPLVVKADGLAAGKGVTVAWTWETAEQAIRDCLVHRIFGEAGDVVVIEEFLPGEEASVLAFSDGRTVVPMVPAQDHKPALDGDQGPNTGGMGAYSPAPVVDAAMGERIRREILEPAVRGLAAEGEPYVGVLYAGLMITAAGPKVVEFNCRFGDPEAQVVIPRLESDLAAVCLAAVDGRLDQEEITWGPDHVVCVVLASGGYPASYATGYPIQGLEAAAALPGVQVFHAGTEERDGQVLTAGGRVLGVTASGGDIAQAVEQAYRAVDCIQFRDMHFRRDIGHRALVSR